MPRASEQEFFVFWIEKVTVFHFSIVPLWLALGAINILKFFNPSLEKQLTATDDC